MNNPLLNSFNLPSFSSIYPKHFLLAIKTSIKYCKNIVENIFKKNITKFDWNNLCQPIDEINDNLNKIWSIISHLNTVKNNLEIRKEYKKCLILISNYNTWLIQNKQLYLAYCNLRNNNNYLKLNIAQKSSLNNIIKSYEISGINITNANKEEYKKIINKLSELSATYSNNVLDATNSWNKLIIDKKELMGVPKNILTLIKNNAKKIGKKGWLLTLNTNIYISIITYCYNTELRKEIYIAYNTRASNQDQNKWDNSEIIKDIIKFRYKLAKLLGFNNYNSKSLVTKLAKSPIKVLNFLKILRRKFILNGKKEYSELSNFAKKYFNCIKLYPWDIAFYSEKQKQYLFSINNEQLKSYFPDNKVIEGLFKIISDIYGVLIKEKYNIDVWDNNVRFFDIINKNNEIQGSFYLDLYSRKNKYNGAWMHGFMNMMKKSNNEIQKPIAYVICNFTKITKYKYALLNHNEIITLFHEFGHVIQHILTCIDTVGVSGINGIPLDAVELSSKFMENYCWQPEILKLISSHYKTNKKISDRLIKKITKTKNYQISLFILRQIELSLFDFYIHETNTEKDISISNIIKKIKKTTSIIPNTEYNKFSHTFTHIFDGGYASGYYSYLWSEVLAADIWFYFQEKGFLNQSIGKLFLKTILSRGGSEDPLVLFKRFRGRKPELSYMLSNYGIKDNCIKKNNS